MDFKRKQLYDMLWIEHKSLTKIAKEYSVPFQRLKKALADHKLPYPGNSFWGKLQMGIDISKDVPPFLGDPNEIISVYPTENRFTWNERKSGLIEIPERFKNIDDCQKVEILAVAKCLSVSEDSQLHEAIVNYKNSIIAWERYNREQRWNDKHPFNRREIHYAERPAEYFKAMISDEGIERSYRILNALFHAVEQLGGTINADFSMKIMGYTVKVEFSEYRGQTPHEMTPDETEAYNKYKEDKKYNVYAYKPYIQKYDHPFNGKLKLNVSYRCYFRDQKELELENQLGAVLLALYDEAEKSKEEDEAKKLAEYQEYVREKNEADAQARIDSEELSVRILMQQAQDFETATQIRTMVSVLKDKGKVTAKWVEWALKKADWIDPSIDAEDPILGNRNRLSKGI